jgi:serine/threonine-protein kinase
MSDPHEVLHDELGDRYELEDTIGEGGMGTVYLARDRKHDRLVAIKTVRPDLTTQEVRDRFKREISITAQLQHPHILPLLDSGSAGETLYYVMPYVEGESLRDRLERSGRIPADELVRIARDVTEALQCAHEQGVVHRDIKPENILLTADYAVVTDFGIAKALVETGADTLTTTGLAVGSPAYMAPEQITGRLTPRSDIYALGADV